MTLNQNVLASYMVRYLRGLPMHKKEIRSVQMCLLDSAFLFEHKKLSLTIPYDKVEGFELVKGSRYLEDTMRAGLFEIAYIDDSNMKATILFEMWHAKINLAKNYEYCEELVRIMKSHGLFNKFINPPQSTPPIDVPAQIKQLADLHASGILTDEEFQNKKTELLSKM